MESEQQLLDWAKRYFRCSATRLSSFPSKHFLIIGRRRSTRQDGREGKGIWYRDGKPHHFYYLEESIVGSGATLDEVKASAKEFKRLAGMSMNEWLRRFISGKEKPLV